MQVHVLMYMYETFKYKQKDKYYTILFSKVLISIELSKPLQTLHTEYFIKPKQFNRCIHHGRYSFEQGRQLSDASQGKKKGHLR